MEHDQLANLLGALSVALTDAQVSALKKASDLNPSAASAIITLGANPGLSIGDVSKVLGVSHSAAVRAIDGLVGKELARRDKGADRRNARVSLTAKGKRLRIRLTTARRAVLEDCLVGLAPNSQDALAEILIELLENLTVGRTQADHICRLCDESVCRPNCCPVEQKAICVENTPS